MQRLHRTRDVTLHVVIPNAGAPLRRLAVVALLAGAVANTPAFGADAHTVVPDSLALKPTPPQRLIDRITAVGSPGRARTLPGSAAYVDDETLSHLDNTFDDIRHVMLRVPGVVVLENGYGLRPDIGMRTAGALGSARITLLEDGVLAAPAPYAAPAALDFPVLSHIDGVEVRKGSSQIEYGPRTEGGVVNLLSSPPAEDLVGRARFYGGSNRANAVDLAYGDSWHSASWMLQGFTSRTDGYQVLDGGGDTGFDVQDYFGTFRLRSAPDANRYQEITITSGWRTDTSHASMVGLSDADFAAHPYRRYAGSRQDVSSADAWRGMLRHFVAVNDRLDVTTTIYRHDLDYDSDALSTIAGTPVDRIIADPAAHPAEYGDLTGATASAADALSVHAGTQSFYAEGIESIAGLHFDTGSWNHDVEAGARIHKDEEDRLFRTDGYRMNADGTMTRTSKGIDGGAGGGDNQVNAAKAFAAYARDRVTRGRVSIEPGLRLEWVKSTRTQYAAADPTRSSAPGVVTGTTTVLLPGVGAVVRATPALDVFAGVYRALSPPAPGLPDSARASRSVNVEAGVRGRAGVFRASLLGYLDDADRLAGTGGAGERFNAGSARVTGVELTVSGGLRTPDFTLNASAAYAYTHAEFRSTFVSDYGPWGSVAAGDAMPYIPAHTVSATLEFSTHRSSAGVLASWVDRMQTVPGADAAHTDARFLLDISTEYELFRHVRVFAAAENLTDAVYVATRYPAGARAGLPQTFSAGLKLEL